MPQSTETASKSDRLKVFLCHSSGDKKAVRDLYAKLSSDGLDPWLDEKNLLPGQDWKYEISKAVRKTDAVVVCVSKSSVSKEGFLQKEIRKALDVAEEKPEGTIFIIPARIEECEIPDRLARWHWVNLFEEHGYENLIRALQARAIELGITVAKASGRLSDSEELALGLVLASPNAAGRGAWLYPLHQDLRKRGCSEAEATLALKSLTTKGLLRYVEVDGWDSDTKRRTKSPAYQITDAGLEYASHNERIRNFNERYSYHIVLRGSQEENQPFLDYLWSLPHIEGQTRFIVESDPQLSRIAVWSYQALDEKFLRGEVERLHLTLVAFLK